MEFLDHFASCDSLADVDRLKKIIAEREEWFDKKGYIHYKELLSSLPKFNPSSIDLTSSAIKIGKREDVNDEQFLQVEKLAKELIPWRKGPFELFGLPIDSEWRSDFKWDRLVDSIGSLEGKKILDIGCNNGYFMFRMMEHKPAMVLGIDPVVHYCSQFRFLNHFTSLPNLFFELLGIEHLPLMKNSFDLIFSMGILYHHRHPMEQLMEIRDALVTGGEAIIETIGIPGEESVALFPEDRYSKMRNVWFLPTLNCFINWVKRAKFADVEVVSVSTTSFEEQRITPWCPPPHQSLEDFLDPADPTKTVEGYPAPMRFCIKAKKR